MSHRVPRRVVLGAVLAAGVGAISACTGPTTNGQATTAVTAALEQAGSAVESTDLTISLLDEGRLSPAVADTSLLDQIRVLEEAATGLTTLVAPANLTGVRTTALTAVGEASAAVVAARAWVAGEVGEGGPATATAVLESLATAGDQVDAALAEVGA